MYVQYGINICSKHCKKIIRIYSSDVITENQNSKKSETKYITEKNTMATTYMNKLIDIKNTITKIDIKTNVIDLHNNVKNTITKIDVKTNVIDLHNNVKNNINDKISPIISMQNITTNTINTMTNLKENFIPVKTINNVTRQIKIIKIIAYVLFIITVMLGAIWGLDKITDICLKIKEIVK